MKRYETYYFFHVDSSGFVIEPTFYAKLWMIEARMRTRWANEARDKALLRMKRAREAMEKEKKTSLLLSMIERLEFPYQ